MRENICNIFESHYSQENGDLLKMLYYHHCSKKINLDRFVFYNFYEENVAFLKRRYSRRNNK